MSGSGKGGTNNRRRPFKRREKDGENWQASSGQGKKGGDKNRDTRDNPRFDKTRGVMFDRPKWSPPKMPSEPIPTPDCPYCGKPVKDISSAMTDKNTGAPVHFDCVLARLGESERLEKGDAVAYIGGGRFGIVHYKNPQDMRNFEIKRIFEWENKDQRADWRNNISDHYSMT
ncbi:hypothetical protein AGMMS49928_18340 [Spirochaetia bacterium]|nr:hypothetical protein AGMMS49928_18340 [Spirochaetia bacterium]